MEIFFFNEIINKKLRMIGIRFFYFKREFWFIIDFFFGVKRKSGWGCLVIVFWR